MYVLEIVDQLQNISNSYVFTKLKDIEHAIMMFVYFMEYDFEECYENDTVKMYLSDTTKKNGKEKIDYRKYL